MRDIRQVKLGNREAKPEFCKRAQGSLDHPFETSPRSYDGLDEIVTDGNPGIHQYVFNRACFTKRNENTFFIKPVPVPNEKSLRRMQLFIWF